MGAELPTIASFGGSVTAAPSGRCRQGKPWLHYPHGSGRDLSLSKVMVHRLWVTGAGGGGGAFSVTVVCDEAVWPLSSTTLQVTVIVVLGAAPVVDRVAEEVLPLIDPAVAL